MSEPPVITYQLRSREPLRRFPETPMPDTLEELEENENKVDLFEMNPAYYMLLLSLMGAFCIILYLR